MSRGSRAADAGGVRAVGGHTMRLRDAGENQRLGGYGPTRESPSRPRDPEDKDDILLLEPCRSCHPGLDEFDRNGLQRKVYERWVELGSLLRAANNNVLPGFPPGDKCAKCHRGGTLPFDNDPKLILENAYTNYKLIGNDRSFGVHNPAYTLKLLEDSIKSVKKMGDALK